MNKQQEEKIKREIEDNVQWLEDGQVKKLSPSALSTIMAILRVNLSEE